METSQQLVYPLQREIKKDVTEHVCICTRGYLCVCSKSGNIESLLVSCVCVFKEITMTVFVTINMVSCEADPLNGISVFRDKSNMYTQFKV